MSTKSIEAWERERGLVIQGDVDPSQEVTAEEFEKLRVKQGHLGVNHEDREQFLKDNGYELSRENLVDASLSAVPKPE